MKTRLTRRTMLCGGCVVLAASVGGMARSAEVRDGVAPVGPANAFPDPETGMLRVRLDFAPGPSRRRVVGADVDPTRVGRLLARLVFQGRAAGLHGDVYDNRDRGHSAMRHGRHPALSRTVYDPAFVAQGLDYGLNDRLDFEAVTLGNSSTAIRAGPLSRSLPRYALTRGDGAVALQRHYARNHVYVYPSHRDHLPEKGDLFPANSPYYLASEGSSGSDRPILDAVATVLAALRPETKTFLTERGLIAPVVQTVLRRALSGPDIAVGYLHSAAHPTAFPPRIFDHETLIRRAQEITPETAPAVVEIAVAFEAAEGPPADPFGDLAAERLLDAPASVARVALGPAPLRRYVLRATPRDAAGRPTTTVWRVLRGAGVRLTLLSPDGRAVAVEIPWQDPLPVPGRPEMRSIRAEIAAFADNGAGLGPPAFFCVAFYQDRQARYDAAGRISAVDYAASAEGALLDPALVPLRPWRDAFSYDAAGVLLGWTRTRTNGAIADYCRNGHRVTGSDALGRPDRVRPPRYDLVDGPQREGRRVVTETEGATEGRYVYAGPGDRLGVLVL